MKIAVIGANGNMGKRYCQILKYLEHEYVAIDIDTNNEELAAGCDGVIIATPTGRHDIDILKWHHYLGKPILCEKPISTDIERVEAICGVPGINLRMINQYRYFVMQANPMHMGLTSYDYFKTGTDGLYWDCINIIGQASERIVLQNESPIWRCQINCYPLNVGEMDLAYIWNIRNWLKKFDGQFDYIDYILKAHKKVRDLINDNGINRDSG